MSIQINGTSGISGVDGSATTPALQGTDTNTGLTFGTDTVGVVTGGTTRATVDANGDFSVNTDAIFVDASTDRVGIGNTNPSVPLEVGGSDADGTIFLQSGSNDYLQIYATSPDGSYCEIDSQREFRLRTESGDMRFATSNTDRMEITSSGRVGVNTTNFTNGRLIVTDDGSSTTPFVVRETASGTGSVNTVGFFRGSSVVGTIATTGSATAYNTSSDYRLKENVVDLDGAITRVKQLAPKRFNFIADANKTVDGFLAHEAQAVVPEAVTGTHNELEVWRESEELPEGVSAGDTKLDEDGNPIPKYQGIDQSKLVPLLTAALQEAIGKIEALETRVAQLEGGAA